ncbi:MAG: acyl-CoA dehydrogenase family protein, partial [Panacagrimonas sp.]
MNDTNSASTESLTTRIRQVQEATRGISEQFPRAYIRECIEQDRFPDEMWKALGDYGLLGLTVPEEYGGSGGGVVEIVALAEALALGGVPTLFLVVTGLGRVPIVRNGTPEQIRKFVTPTCDGSVKLCFAITEPNAGTNSFNMSTLATR